MPILVILAEVIGGVIFGPFSNVDNFRREAYGDVISGLFVASTGVKVPEKFGDYMSNSARNIRLPHFVTNNDDNENDAGRRTL